MTTTDQGSETELMVCAELYGYNAAVYVLQNSENHEKGTVPRAMLDMIYCLPSGVDNTKFVHILKTPGGCYTTTDISDRFEPNHVSPSSECVEYLCFLRFCDALLLISSIFDISGSLQHESLTDLRKHAKNVVDANAASRVTVAIYPSKYGRKFSVPVCQGDTEVFEHGDWLNDVIVDFATLFLVDQELEKHNMGGACSAISSLFSGYLGPILRKVHSYYPHVLRQLYFASLYHTVVVCDRFVSCFQYVFSSEEFPVDEAYEEVKHFLKIACPFDWHFVFVPVFVPGHFMWSLVCRPLALVRQLLGLEIDSATVQPRVCPSVLFGDSMGSSGTAWRKAIALLLVKHYTVLHGLGAPMPKWSELDNALGPAVSVPEQHDGWTCAHRYLHTNVQAVRDIVVPSLMHTAEIWLVQPESVIQKSWFKLKDVQETFEILRRSLSLQDFQPPTIGTSNDMQEGDFDMVNKREQFRHQKQITEFVLKILDKFKPSSEDAMTMQKVNVFD